MQGTQYAPRESILCMEHFVALQRAHVYTRMAIVATLVGWQVNKVNSLACPLSILHCI